MANFATLLRRVGLIKETTRGTAETTPTTWVSVYPASEMKYGLQLLPDMALRGVLSKYPSRPGQISVVGKILFPLRASEVGEFLHMFIGDATSVQQVETTAYLHTWTPATTLQPDSYTITFDHNMEVKKYNGCNVSSIKLTRTTDNFIMFEAGIIGRTEAAGSIGSPTYVESSALTFQHDVFKIAGTTYTQIKQWEIEMDNGLFPMRATSGSQLIVDTFVTEHSIKGSFTTYFENATERDKFVAGTSATIQVTITGAVIGGASSYYVDIFVDVAEYEAFPYESEDGLLAAKVVWRGTYDTTDSRIYRFQAQNITASYT
mgnify:CR=1 FL=1